MGTEKLIRQYKIVSELGEGGMGTVFKGLDTQTSQPVAIKELKPDRTSPELIERFQREGQALRDLNHPNIVKMLETIDEGSKHYLVMEYVGGGDLKTILEENGPLDHKHCINMAIDLADALTRAHRLNIIHRDLKPANILIGEDNVARLTDFGVAHVESKERLTDTNAVVGTIDYLAPEALQGEAIDARADIWAFGVMLFEMLTGERPFTGGHSAAILTAILQQPTPDLEQLCPDTPIALVDLVYRMLEKNPHARIASIRHVGAELEDILYGRASKPPPTRFETPRPDTLAWSRPKHNLPTQPTPFVGREHELAELSKLLDDPNARLSTILAPGGMGKSRLALEVGERCIAPENTQFPDGTYFVELAPLSDPSNIPLAIAEATGFQFSSDQSNQKQQILDFLGNKDMLLILDNYEHLLGGADLTGEILHAAPHVKMLVTSRQRLNQPGESIFHLSGMDFPDWETPEDAEKYAAVKLFMNSAIRARPDFELAADNLDYIARICRLVQGMPLGIVLAAAWINTLSAKEVAEELQNSIDILEDDIGQVPERQHSIRVVLDYSWQTMSSDEQAVFMKMSVFRGGMTRKAAQSVTGASLRQLMSLVNKSLIRRDNDSGRYDIHELLRQYAGLELEKSGEEAATRDTHMTYYADAIKERESGLKGSRQVEALNDIKQDFENVKVAWHWALQHHNLNALDRMLEPVMLYCFIRFQAEDVEELLQPVENWLRDSNVPEQRVLWGRMLRWRAEMAQFDRDPENGSYEAAVQALELARESNLKFDIATATSAVSRLASFFGHWQESKDLGKQALEMFRELDDKFYEVVMLHRLGFSFAVRGTFSEFEVGISYWEEGADKGRELGESFWTAWMLMNLGFMKTAVRKYQDLEDAEALFLESLKLCRQVSGKQLLVQALGNLQALYWLKQGRIEDAERVQQERLRILRDTNDRNARLMALEAEASIYRFREQYDEASKLLDEAEAFITPSDNKLVVLFVKLRRAETLMGMAEYEAAAKIYYATLPILLQDQQIMQVLRFAFAMACVLAFHHRELERATAFVALLTEYPLEAIPWEYDPVAQRLLAYLKAELSPADYEAAWERGKSLDLETVTKEWVEEFGEVDEG